MPELLNVEYILFRLTNSPDGSPRALTKEQTCEMNKALFPEGKAKGQAPPSDLVLRLLKGVFPRMPQTDYERIDFICQALLRYGRSSSGLDEAELDKYQLHSDIIQRLVGLQLLLPARNSAPLVSRRLPLFDLIKSPRETLRPMISKENVHKVCFCTFS